MRVALMDYLKTHHPNDSEKMQMVALKFGMFYELAKAKQEQAKRDLKRIKPKHLGRWRFYKIHAHVAQYFIGKYNHPLCDFFVINFTVSNNAETVKTLKTAFETLRTAANTYAQVCCVLHA